MRPWREEVQFLAGELDGLREMASSISGASATRSAMPEFCFFHRCCFQQIRLAHFRPFLGAGSITNNGIDIFALHQAQGLLMAQIMTGALQTHFTIVSIARFSGVTSIPRTQRKHCPIMSLSTIIASSENPNNDACMPMLS